MPLRILLLLDFLLMSFLVVVIGDDGVDSAPALFGRSKSRVMIAFFMCDLFCA